MGRIVINIKRQKKGDRHSGVEITTFYDTDVADDMALHNAMIELYETWNDSMRQAMPGVKVIEQGMRK